MNLDFLSIDKNLSMGQRTMEEIVSEIQKKDDKSFEEKCLILSIC